MTPDMSGPNGPVVPATRRRFLTVASAVSASVTALLVGAPALRALLSPVLKRPAKRD